MTENPRVGGLIPSLGILKGSNNKGSMVLAINPFFVEWKNCPHFSKWLMRWQCNL